MFLLSFNISAQDQEANRVLSKLGLSEDQIEKVFEIRTQTERVVRESQIELNILKAQLQKQLFKVNPDMNHVEKILRESMEWKLKIELSQIKARVAIRKLVGEEKWIKYLNWTKMRQQRQRQQKLNNR
jgi:hypothetical protein